jgi:hypothetical protein
MIAARYAGITACLLTTPALAACDVTVSVASYHFDRSQPQNERNPGLGIECPLGAEWYMAAGAYRNSHLDDGEDKHSAYLLGMYAPWRYGPVRIGVGGGLVTGYDDDPMPMAGVTLTFDVHRNLAVGALVTPVVTGFYLKLKWDAAK